MFTNTVGDAGRGERIAAAVLADDDARAEIVAPVTEAILVATPATPEMEAAVAQRVDALLQSPKGAQVFIAPFAGSWARMLGEDDPRPADFDVAPLADEIVAAVPGLEAADLPADPLTARFDVPAVPLPRTRLGWMGDVRSIVRTATLVLAVAAAIGFVTGFAIGDRRWTLRRAGLWAALAGVGWVLIPPLVTWGAGRWATGADSVIEVAVREAVRGLRTTALLLTLAGVACFAASFMPAVGRLLDRPQPKAPRRSRSATNAELAPAVRRRHTPAADAVPPRRTIHTRPAVEADFGPPPGRSAPVRRQPEPTVEMPPAHRRSELHHEPRPEHRPEPGPGPRSDEFPIRELPVDSPDIVHRPDGSDVDGDDDVWDFYGPRGSA